MELNFSSTHPTLWVNIHRKLAWIHSLSLKPPFLPSLNMELTRHLSAPLNPSSLGVNFTLAWGVDRRSFA
eukprot:scaffold47_cov334-Pavlova_lutheri.AAC.69